MGPQRRITVCCDASSAYRRFFSAAAWPQGAARRMSGPPSSTRAGSHLPGWRESSPEKTGGSTIATLTAGPRTPSRNTRTWSTSSASSRPRLPPPARLPTARFRSGSTARCSGSSSRRARTASFRPLSRSKSKELRPRRSRVVRVGSFASFLPGRAVPPARSRGAGSRRVAQRFAVAAAPSSSRRPHTPEGRSESASVSAGDSAGASSAPHGS
jgi:hypothetical protein